MILDTIHGIIDRRVLLNYRIDPTVLSRVLPQPFQPKLHDGYGVGGVCMIRFKQLRPHYVPQFFGLGSENAAHRIAVQWTQDGAHREGVYIPRRDTNSWFNKTLGGRLFPGIFQRSKFETKDSDTDVFVRIIREDGREEIAFSGRKAAQFSTESIFSSLDESANFFSLGATGYSATDTENHYHGMELHSLDWSVSPLTIETARSCFFDDSDRFPSGSVELDCALLMRGIRHEWRSRPDLYSTPGSHCLSTKAAPKEAH
ncbi:hypothetical protein Pla123a_23070 [Posidoniimonas polymericola]|uniref:DUF2071 domain-containing protein n=1 Tax=Posidoniimonas polymericola TaxID=2528002 RepID=A0A5C5YPT4_9BACT|nr:DUF2071 domain-containing protein [Posidoniimonas polymericola]TWT76883.1 hypothetical protein Pla123a_23070 [Posidoniimonas polymericola]